MINIYFAMQVAMSTRVHNGEILCGITKVKWVAKTFSSQL